MGTPYSQLIESEADSLEEARKQIKSQIPQGLSIRSEKILSNGEPETAIGIAVTMEEAFSIAQDQVPNDAKIMDKKELTHPERKVVMVEAYDEQNASVLARKKIDSDAIIQSTKLTAVGNKGFLGIGRKPNQYSIEVLHQAVAEITYKTKAKIVAEIGRPKATSDERYLLTCTNCGFTHRIAPDLRGDNFAWSVDVDEIRMICVWGGSFTVTLEVGEFFTITTVPNSGERSYASIQESMKALHNHLLSHCDPLFLNLGQYSNRTTHTYSKHHEGSRYVKYTKDHGADMIGNIDVSKAEIPGVSW